MGTRHSGYDRADGDFYSEPPWTISALLRHVPMCGSIHDPCCGIGTVVDTAAGVGFEATGADVADRAGGRFPVRDFLNDETSYTNFVFNPPYRLTLEFVRHARCQVAHGGHVAALAPLGSSALNQGIPFTRSKLQLHWSCLS